MNLSITEMIRSSWVIFKRNPWPFVGAVVVLAVVTMVSNSLGKSTSTETQGFTQLLNLALTIVSWWLYLGFIKMAFDAKAGMQITFSDLFAVNGKMLWQYITAMVLVILVFLGIIVAFAIVGALILGVLGAGAFTLGASGILSSLASPELLLASFGGSALAILIILMIVFAVVVIFVQIRLTLVPFVVVDMKIGWIDAFKESWKLMKGHVGRVFLIILSLALLNIIGLMALIVGLLVTVPLSLCTLVDVYQKLKGAVQPQVATAPQG